MRAFTKVLAGGVLFAALASAAPAMAQYYPGYGDPYGGNVVGQVLNSVLGGGYGGYGSGYGVNSQVAINQCAAAAQARLSRTYAYGSPYGYGGGARVLGITRVEPRGDGGLRIRGVATTGYNASPDLTFSCKTDYRGYIRDVDVDRGYSNYNYGYQPYNNYDYSQYGYRRY
jgi:hypothetical protein